MALDNERKSEIEESRKQTETTFRVSSPGIEEILYKPLEVLDHGFIRVIDYMGNDNSVVQAARVSYGKGTKKTSEDRGLIQYLMRHHHTTPFEMCDIKLHVKLPIFIARQWIRHRTASVNEYSARYSILDNEFYIPKREQLAAQSKSNRQGRDEILDDENAKRVFDLLIEDSKSTYDHYREMLNEDENGNIIDENKTGLARELARMNLTLNYYTEWYWKTNLHNLLNFIRLRADSHAQYEIRVYAEIMQDIVKKWVPLTYEAFMEYRVNSVGVSGKGVKALKELIKGDKVTQETSGMSKREWAEFSEMFELQKILTNA